MLDVAHTLLLQRNAKSVRALYVLSVDHCSINPHALPYRQNSFTVDTYFCRGNFYLSRKRHYVDHYIHYRV